MILPTSKPDWELRGRHDQYTHDGSCEWDVLVNDKLKLMVMWNLYKDGSPRASEYVDTWKEHGYRFISMVEYNGF